MRTISFTLDPKSIGQAAKAVRAYAVDVRDAVQKLAEYLTLEGADIAKLEVLSLGAFDTGQLADSIHGFYNTGTHIGIIHTDVYYACYVEYGTGVVGQSNPHPEPRGWEYDIHGHGTKGWVYFSERDNDFHWTTGVPSRPFMYNTMRHLERLAVEKWNSMNL